MSKARCAILEEFSTKPWRFVSGTRIAQFDLVIREQVWHELSDYLKGITGKKDGNVRAEEAMAEAMRSGVRREDIRFRKKAFIAHLKNTQFRVRKRDCGFAAGPETVGGYGSEEMGWCSPSMFAHLMLTFDALIPQIDREAALIIEEVIEAQRSIEREKMAEMVQMTAIKALVDKYLSPLGIACATTVKGDRVSLQLELLKRGSIEASIEELPSLLEDTDAVMEALTPVNERKLFLHR